MYHSNFTALGTALEKKRLDRSGEAGGPEERTVNPSLSHLSQGCSRWQDGEMHETAPDGGDLAGKVELEVSHGQKWFPHKWAVIMFSCGTTSSGWEQG